MGRGERGDQSDAEWERLRPFLPVSNGWCGRWRGHRQVIDGILPRVRTGAQWCDLPERFGTSSGAQVESAAIAEVATPPPRAVERTQ
ncbi:transposase [Streptomyces sp. NPDC002835]